MKAFVNALLVISAILLRAAQVLPLIAVAKQHPYHEGKLTEEEIEIIKKRILQGLGMKSIPNFNRVSKINFSFWTMCNNCLISALHTLL